MRLYYYGRAADDEKFSPVVRVLNKARAILERAVEVVVTIEEARKNRESLAVVVSQLADEGFSEPGPAGARTPLQEVVTFQGPSAAEGSKPRPRVHGRRRDTPLHRLDGTNDSTLDDTYSLRRGPAREARQRSNRYFSSPLVREHCFERLKNE